MMDIPAERLFNFYCYISLDLRQVVNTIDEQPVEFAGGGPDYKVNFVRDGFYDGELIV